MGVKGSREGKGPQHNLGACAHGVVVREEGRCVWALYRSRSKGLRWGYVAFGCLPAASLNSRPILYSILFYSILFYSSIFKSLRFGHRDSVGT